jgi:general secretion pathway protein E
VARAPARRLKELALAGGAKLLRSAALELVQQGVTTLQEADRVTALA